MDCNGIVYETLSPLSATEQPPPATSDDSEPYFVFRNQISLSSLSCPSPDSAAPDYFSLDVAEDAAEPKQVALSTPSVTPTTPAAGGGEPQRTLESGWFQGMSRFKSPMLQLHKEILDFCDFLSPTPEEQATRQAAVECVFDVIKYIWPNCQVEVFGSFKTGIYLPTSDIDVVILGSNIRTPQIGLVALSRALSQRGIAKNMQVIAKARVPIIKFIEKKSGVAFDISFDVENGPKAAEFIQDAISRWPPLRPLCLILKIFLQQRELNEVYSGGIGSYALLAMLMAMLRVNFFDFYGRKLNTCDVGVSCNGAEIFFLKSSKGFSNTGRPFLIAIEDPQAPENDIGKNSFNYHQIKSAFAMAYLTLTNAKTILGLGPHRSILGTIIRPDPVLVERKGGCSGEMTFNNLLPGAGEPLRPQRWDQQEILCNWQLDDAEEEPLPRGSGIAGDRSAHTFGKKRKAKERLGKKVREDWEVGKGWHEENGSRGGKGIMKKRRGRQDRDGDRGSGHGHHAGRSTSSGRS
ncbi:uncharacterized protein LOC131159538 isoform X2 [Malania oleifera]|uniref:uncharacterized protein LOC131159538 isoform X2 n=1 Tax=Malania oleifera TaxID=397392 RepID=UPI0025AE121C|nr:uncharacterized protein LOC131159538 isoform X2 [Malania oleifera]